MKGYLMLWVLLLGAAGLGSGQTPAADHRQELDRLVDMLKGRQIERVEILHVPDTFVTVIGITPETVRDIARYDVIVRKPWELSSLPGLFVALKELERAPSGPPGEVRWAILFIDSAGRERSAIFLSRNGKQGFFEGVSLSLQGKLLDWSKNLIRSEFLEGSK
jgi:hypothetical protein